MSRPEQTTEALAREVAELRQRIAVLEARDRVKEQAHNPRRWRAHLLRKAQRLFYPGTSRTGCARALECDWRAFADCRNNETPEPGSLEAIFDALIRGGCRPLGWRIIAEDLDTNY